ncbi:uncharacterized protein LOC119998528 [Tripterygium wilfordii]|uniref:uncharacterized protein LOC119998528 n=1 Tax=Tripterygium wilfordii TaxID=458696 RepID=UPI0018F7E6A0|nr:uncharacterized protein LOC119998528 [Tripterygium wilfordii]
MYATSKNFQFCVIKSTKTLFMIHCAAKECEWRMRSIRVKDSELFKVTRLNDNHKCSLDFIYRSHMQTSGKVIGECIKSKYNGVGRIYRPKDIIQDVRQEFDVNISYDKAWRAREATLESVRGMPEDSFSYLPCYCAELEKNNPGTITYIESDHENKFKYFFMALGASFRGFRSAMRPIIDVDGTHLKGKYMGLLFVAATQDGNKKIYPVAFGKLRVALALEDFSELSLISDRHKNIERGVSLVFPESYHGHCMHHIKQSMKAKKIDDVVFPIYFKAAKAYRISDFEHLMTQICGFEGGKAHKYLKDVGFNKWSRAHFPGYRYSILTTNIPESMNAALRDVRGLPITALVE